MSLAGYAATTEATTPPVERITVVDGMLTTMSNAETAIIASLSQRFFAVPRMLQGCCSPTRRRSIQCPLQQQHPVRHSFCQRVHLSIVGMF
jgi:hypothetical protein